MAKIYEQLPVVNQTTAVKNFFESTVEQLFAEANSEIITGFIGKKTSDDHNVDIAYLTEPTVDRTFYSLSPVVNTLNLTTGKSEDFIFFDEYINTLKIYGANTINQDKIFTNLYEKGNTGSASIYVMLEELFNGGRLKDGERILCMVPESGRFIVSFVQMTVIGEATPLKQTSPSVDNVEKPITAFVEPIHSKEDLHASLVRRLATVWLEFERQMHLVPVIERLNRGKLRQEDYQSLLRNLRQQVVEGARWIARAASNITADSFDIRSRFLSHAHEEHRDFLMLEENYVSVGGCREDIVNAEKNIGSEALSAWMFHKSSRENPVDLFGAMFIIEGLGHRLAAKWGKAIQNQLDLGPDQVSFLLYHGENDDNHMDRMWDSLEALDLTQRIVDDIVKTAKVTARLYRLQLEELDNL